MPTSEARINANRLNAQHSTGPKTAEGKERSRANSFQHGLTGQGIVVAEDDAAEIESRVAALEKDMKPKSPNGVILIRKMAILSVRTERAAGQESAALALRVRHAPDDFDEERIDHANQLFDTLSDDPRGNLRKLRKSPEGVDRLLDAWRDLRDDLTRAPRPNWTAAHLEQAALITGVRSELARGSRLGALSRGVWGDFFALADSDGGHLNDDARQVWAQHQLVERIDAEMAALEAHRETFDFAMIELDRSEAGSRALFDPSKEASLARRYEAEANRGFFKALKEFRQVEAEAKARAEVARATPPPPAWTPGMSASLGSTGDRQPSTRREPDRSDLDDLLTEFSMVRDRDGQPLTVGRPAPTPR